MKKINTNPAVELFPIGDTTWGKYEGMPVGFINRRPITSTAFVLLNEKNIDIFEYPEIKWLLINKASDLKRQLDKKEVEELMPAIENKVKEGLEQVRLAEGLGKGMHQDKIVGIEVFHEPASDFSPANIIVRAKTEKG